MFVAVVLNLVFDSAIVHESLANDEILRVIKEPTMRFCRFPALNLGGHPKTGHTWSLQNRPTDRTQGMTCFTRS